MDQVQLRLDWSRERSVMHTGYSDPGSGLTGHKWVHCRGGQRSLAEVQGILQVESVSGLYLFLSGAELQRGGT